MFKYTNQVGKKLFPPKFMHQLENARTITMTLKEIKTIKELDYLLNSKPSSFKLCLVAKLILFSGF